MNDLLELALREGAEELRLRTGAAPVMVRQGTSIAIDVPAVTADNVMELFQSIATREQVEELCACGDIHFIYQDQNSVRFGVTGQMQGEVFDVKFRVLSQQA